MLKRRIGPVCLILISQSPVELLSQFLSQNARPTCHSSPQQPHNRLPGRVFDTWAWVELNYRPHAYQANYACAQQHSPNCLSTKIKVGARRCRSKRPGVVTVLVTVFLRAHRIGRVDSLWRVNLTWLVRSEVHDVIASGTASAVAQAKAKPVEKWECRDYIADNWKNILVRATVDSGRTTGTITVAGVENKTHFEVEGFNRRWDWGSSPSGGYRFSFVITPDGTGRYYDFGDATHLEKAQDVMKCRQRDV